MNTCTYLIHTLSLIYAIKLLVIFGIKIYRKLPSYLTYGTCIDSRSLDKHNKQRCKLVTTDYPFVFECGAKTGPARYTHEPAPYQA